MVTSNKPFMRGKGVKSLSLTQSIFYLLQQALDKYKISYSGIMIFQRREEQFAIAGERMKIY
jgi:hypothetical protein